MVAPHVAALAAGMLVAGTINTVATKLQDMTPVDADGIAGFQLRGSPDRGVGCSRAQLHRR